MKRKKLSIREIQVIFENNNAKRIANKIIKIIGNQKNILINPKEANITNRQTRDQFIKKIYEIFQSEIENIHNILLKNFKYQVNHIKIDFYKQNDNFTDIYVLFTIILPKNNTIFCGLQITKIKKDIFAEKIDYRILNSASSKKSFIHYQTINSS
jgi:hypothetical protein